MSTPARSLKSSPARCGTVPLPAEQNVSVPGFALAIATSSALPTVVPAPGLFSTMTDRPSLSLSFCAAVRAMMSVAPPGANGFSVAYRRRRIPAARAT